MHKSYNTKESFWQKLHEESFGISDETTPDRTYTVPFFFLSPGMQHTKNWKALYAFRFLWGWTWFGRETVECSVLEAAGKVASQKILHVSSVILHNGTANAMVKSRQSLPPG